MSLKNATVLISLSVQCLKPKASGSQTWLYIAVPGAEAPFLSPTQAYGIYVLGFLCGSCACVSRTLWHIQNDFLLG